MHVLCALSAAPALQCALREPSQLRLARQGGRPAFEPTWYYLNLTTLSMLRESEHPVLSVAMDSTRLLALALSVMGQLEGSDWYKFSDFYKAVNERLAVEVPSVSVFSPLL